jgi:predicted deacylase
MTFNPSEHARGARYDFDLATGAGDLTLPVILLRGARPGKTLVVTAGVHGDEYEGVRTLIELTRELDPAAMAGDLLCAPVCNPPAFWEVTRTSPLDGGNLARVFPGRADGSPTEAMAWLIDHALLAYADFYLDLHSAGVRCQMPNLIGYEASNAAAAEAARLFGAPVVWAHDVVAPGRTVSSARARGVPSLYAEAFGAGRIDPADLAIYKDGVRNLLHHLGILDGPPSPPRPFRFLCGDGNVDASVTTAKRGFLIPEVAILDTVAEGQTLGRLHDLHGRVIEEYRAPSAGVVALIHACPVIRDGDPLFLVTGERAQ